MTETDKRACRLGRASEQARTTATRNYSYGEGRGGYDVTGGWPTRASTCAATFTSARQP